jgi:hypothetical protein
MLIGDKLSVSSEVFVPAKGLPGSSAPAGHDFSAMRSSRMPVPALYLSIVTAWTIIIS